jgi:hypothetical protein
MLRIFSVAIIVVFPCPKANEYNDLLIMETQFAVLNEYSKPERSVERIKRYLLVAGTFLLCGMVPSFISIVIYLETLKSEASIIRPVLFWNVWLAFKLVTAGLLPICENCEMMSLVGVLFWAFVIGTTAYGLVCGLIFVIINRVRTRLTL